MSFIKITTMHPEGREVTGITQQVHVTAREAYENRLKRVKVIPGQGYDANGGTLTIHLHPTEVVDYEQLLEYAETIEAFDVIQPGLFEVTP